MGIKNLIIKNKKLVIGLTIALSLGFFSGTSGVTKEEYNLLLIEKEQIDKETVEIDRVIEEQQKNNDELISKKLEKEKLVAEEKEKARVEAERIASEEKLAREEAERFAKEEAERIALEQEALIVGTDTSSDNYVEETEIGEMVWLSATGSKYHRINNCGKMNPDTSRQVSVDEASQSYGACSKCY